MLPPLQAKGPPDELDQLDPLTEDDPHSFDLVMPAGDGHQLFSLEERSQQLFSREHLQVVFLDPALLLKFTAFLSTHRPQSVPILIYYLDALKALKAISYANAIAEALQPIEGYDFASHPARATVNSTIEDKAAQAFDVLVREDLPAYITHIYIQVVSLSITRRITGTLPPHLREASEGLAEVFCLSDPARPDNPIVFASEGMNVVCSPTNRDACLTCTRRVPPNNSVRHELRYRTELSVPPGPEDEPTECAKDRRSCRSWERTL